MDLALCILAGGVVLVAVLLVIKCPRDKVVELAEAFAHWISGAPKPPTLPLGPPTFQVQIMPQPGSEAEPVQIEPGEIEPPAA